MKLTFYVRRKHLSSVLSAFIIMNYTAMHSQSNDGAPTLSYNETCCKHTSRLDNGHCPGNILTNNKKVVPVPKRYAIKAYWRNGSIAPRIL